LKRATKSKSLQWQRFHLVPAVGSAGVSRILPVNIATAQIALGLIAAGANNHTITMNDINAVAVLVAHPQEVLRGADAQVVAQIPQPQRDWFFANKAALVAEHGGLYVAVSGNRVFGTDAVLSRLVKRFYNERGQGDVYFGYAGEQEPVVGVPSYFA